MKIKSWSGMRIGVQWYDDEAEADLAGEAARQSPGAADASIGIAQVGRDPARDTTIDGQPGYAVVIP